MACALGRIGVSPPVIEQAPLSNVPVYKANAPVPIESQRHKFGVPALGPEVLPETETSGAHLSKKVTAKPAEPVIPLIRVPDDPGPNSDLEAEEKEGTISPERTWHDFQQRFQ